jgi:RsiW-degrading membrane proteinase PrsW (M82 family)
MIVETVAAFIILLVGAYVPTLAALVWLRWGERGRKEHWDDLLQTFLGGAIIAIVVAIVLEVAASELLLSTIAREYELFTRNPNLITFMAIIVLAPIIEEFAKVMVVRRFSRHIWRPRNGLVFGAACGLGFAASENFLYEGTALFQEGFYAFLAVALVRSFSSALMHASATSISGYGVAREKTYGDHWWPYLAAAILMHASFNLFASFGSFFRTPLGSAAEGFGLIFSIVLVVAAVLFIRNRLHGYHA